ncbi:hypothetical protein M3Y95_00853300 [Aphelenchoides besseyi]|nr:hypothetical protein M3Y95_00853300 [Aphelenchoides besseyi]
MSTSQFLLTFGLLIVAFNGGMSASLRDPRLEKIQKLKTEQVAQLKFLARVAPMTAAQSNDDFLCEPCLKFFEALKDTIGDVGDITVEGLTKALNTTCKYLEDQQIPLIDKICQDLGPAIIDFLYEYLTEVDKEINPQHLCKLIFLCHLDEPQHKMQKPLVKHNM